MKLLSSQKKLEESYSSYFWKKKKKKFFLMGSIKMTNYIYRIKEFSNCSKQRKSSKTKTLYWTRNNLGWSKMKTNKLPGDQLAAKFPSFYSSAPLLLACRNPTKGLVSSLESPSLALGVIRIKQNNQPKKKKQTTHTPQNLQPQNLSHLASHNLLEGINILFICKDYGLLKSIRHVTRPSDSTLTYTHAF